MAANQRKKRSSAASNIVPYPEQQRVKKKKVGVQVSKLDMRSNISLLWNDKKKIVVAKKEQIGISWRDIIPFIDALPNCDSFVADVFPIPQETFGLENLSNVLSYEVWQNHLSENERNFLAQFLPKGAMPDETVGELLGGHNFHFGNPFLNWSALVCAGNYHPDDILLKEQGLKAKQKAYYAKLRKYHNDMIGNLNTWKERWASCRNFEEESMQKFWRSNQCRSTKYAGKNRPTSEPSFHEFKENPVGTPDSSSQSVSEKACNSDNPSNVLVNEETQRRKNFSDSKCDESLDGHKVIVKHRKGEKLHKRNIQHGDGARYMSYVKVTKEHYQRVKSSMRSNSNSIQPRSLNNVLGNVDALHVQPFEVYEEEERQKLHEYWLHLANRDLPAGFAKWREMQLQRWQLRESLGQDLKEKLEFQREAEEKETSVGSFPELADDKDADDSHTTMIEDGLDEESENESDGLLSTQMDKEAANLELFTVSKVDCASPAGLLPEQMDKEAANLELFTVSKDEERGKTTYTVEEQMDNCTANIEDDSRSMHVSKENQHIEHTASQHSDGNQFNQMNIDPCDNCMNTESHETTPVSEFHENLNHVVVPVNQDETLASAGDIWPTVSMPGSYCSTTANHGYSPVNSVGHRQGIEEQSTQLVNMESEKQEDGGKTMLHRQTGAVSFFSSYPNQNRNELFQSFFKDQGNPSYNHERKQMTAEFQPAASVMESAQFAGHFREQLQPSLPLELRQKELNDLYMHHNIQEGVYADGGRYSVPRQEQLPVSVQDWAVNAARISAPSQSHLNEGDFLSQSWFPGENQARVGWSGLEGVVGSSQPFSSGSNSDQSLFSVLSECNDLRPGASFELMASTEQFIQSGSYGGVSGGVPASSNVMQQATNPLHYLSGHEGAAGFKTNNLGWVSMPHQNSGFQESMGKSFLRSWNQ